MSKTFAIERITLMSLEQTRTYSPEELQDGQRVAQDVGATLFGMVDGYVRGLPSTILALIIGAALWFGSPQYPVSHAAAVAVIAVGQMIQLGFAIAGGLRAGSALVGRCPHCLCEVRGHPPMIHCPTCDQFSAIRGMMLVPLASQSQGAAMSQLK